MTPPRSTAKLLELYQQVQVAIDRHLASPTMLGGGVYTPQQLKDHFAGVAAQVVDADEALASYHVAVLVKTRAVQRATRTLLLIRSAIVARHGRAGAEVLAEFGLAPPPARRRAAAQIVTPRLATRRCPPALLAGKPS